MLSEAASVYTECMSRSVEITTPIPSAQEIAERLGMGVERQEMLLGIVRHRGYASIHRNSKTESFGSKKAPSRRKSDKRAKTKD